MKQIDVYQLGTKYTAHNEKRVREGYCLGSIAGIWTKDGERWRSTVGFADLAGTRRIEGNTVFRLASMTKPITATAFMQVAESGRIDPDTPIAAFLPEYENMSVAYGISGDRVLKSHPASVLITPRHLLSHSSGLGCGTVGIAQSKYIKKTASLADSVHAYAASCLDFDPESNVKYSPIWAFDVLARLVEMVADMPYEDYLKKYILDPLGMVDTTYLPSDEQVARCVDFVEQTPHGLVSKKISPRAGFVGFTDGMVCGGAGLFSTLDDYSRFAQMLLYGGSLDGVRILSPFSMREMTRRQEIFTAGGFAENPFGLGMRVCGEPVGDTQPLPKDSYGWSGAYGTHFWIDVQNRMTCIYMMNLANAGGSDEEAAREFERDVMSSLC